MPNNTGAPKITFNTNDISQVPLALSTSIGAIVIPTKKGSITEPQLVTNVPELIAAYCNGNPAPNFTGIQAAIGFLQQGNQLYVMRASNSALYGGVEFKKTGSPYFSAPYAAGEANPLLHNFGPDGLFAVYATDPGAWNQSLSIAIANINTTTLTFDIQVFLDSTLGTQQLQETWTVSRKVQTDGYGNQLYLTTKINGFSNFIRVVDNPAQVNTVLPKTDAVIYYMASGADGVTPQPADINTAWGVFSNVLAYPVNILMAGGQSDVSTMITIANIASTRQDSFAILDMPLNVATSSVTTQVQWVQNTLNINNSYAAIYTPWIQIFDDYNGQVITVAPSGDVGAIYALTDFIYNGAFGAPAMFNRGVIGRALGLSSPWSSTPMAQGDLDTLCTAHINPIAKYPGYGIVVVDELTLQAQNSALKNVHVRRLINQIQVATTNTARGYLGEPLLPSTYFRVRTEMEQYMAGLQGQGAFDDNLDRGWQVVCDNTNNTANDRDNDTLNIWLFIKPVKVARYIQIQAIITRSSSNFAAVIASGII